MIRTRRLPGFAFEVQPPQLADTLPRMDIAVIVGFAASGPLDIPVLVEDEAHFYEIFGPDLLLARSAEDGIKEQGAPAAGGQNEGQIAVFAYLAPAVRAFFRSGGRRCWVVRVARNPNLAHLPVPGLLSFHPGIAELTPAYAAARSEGTWAECLQTGSALLSLPLVVRELDLKHGMIHLHLERRSDLAPGDLIRLTLAGGQWQGYIFVGSILNSRLAGAVPGDVSVQVANLDPAAGGKLAAFWLQPAWVEKPAGELVVVTRYISQSESTEIQAALPADTQSAGWPTVSEAFVHLNLEIEPDKAPEPGEMLKVQFGARTLWLSVETVTQLETTDELLVESLPSHRAAVVQVSGSGFWQRSLPGEVTTSLPELDGVMLPGQLFAEKLTFELAVRNQGWVSSEPVGKVDGVQAAYANRSSLSDLAFAPIHARYWGGLPTDSELFTVAEAGISPTQGMAPGMKSGTNGGGWTIQPGKAGFLPPFWAEAASPRFPLAGPESDQPNLKAQKAGWYLPLFVSRSQFYLGCPPQSGDRLEREGLAVFDAGLFLDPQLVDANLETLAARAEFLRYLSPTPRKLKGIHAAMAIDEATLVIVPDAIHTGWMKFSPEKPPEPQFDPRRPHPDWWQFCICQDNPSDLQPCQPGLVPLVDQPEWGNFLPKSSHVIESPALWITTQGTTMAAVSGVALSPNGTFSVCWSDPAAEQIAEQMVPEWQLDHPNYVYTLEEASEPDFSDSVVVYQGCEHAAAFYGRSQGLYYYRVRIAVFDYSDLLPQQIPQRHYESDWSNGKGIQSMPMINWIAIPTSEPEDKFSLNLKAIHWGLLRMCAARGDLFAVLAMPRTWGEDSALRYLETLQSGLTQGVPVPAAEFMASEMQETFKLTVMPAIDVGESRAWSFGAIYHPWLIGYEPEPDSNRGAGSTALRLRAVPPDGAACGLAAGRAFTRGAWIAPANQPIGGVVHLTPTIPATRRLELQNAQINLVRQEPGGFVILNADTLSHDPELRQINVRRLISLLRRIVLRVGPTYVFEPNTPAFERMVQRSIESVMTGLFTRGAFAGRKPEDSFQVSVNVSPQDREEGRFIIEIRFAPSLPLTFITIRLVQSGERSIVSE